MKYTSTIVVLLLGQSIPTAQSHGVDFRKITSTESFQKREENDQCFDNLSLDPVYAELDDALVACSRPLSDCGCGYARTTQGSVIGFEQDGSLCDESTINNYTEYCAANYKSLVWPDHNVTCPVPAPTGYPQFAFTYLREFKDLPGCYSQECDVNFENETEALAFHVESVSNETGLVCILNDESSVDEPSEPLHSDLQCLIDIETTIYDANPEYDKKKKAVDECSQTETSVLRTPDGVTLLNQYDYSMCCADVVDDLQEYCNANHKVVVYPDHRVTCIFYGFPGFPPGKSLTGIIEFRDAFDCAASSCDVDFENDDEALAFAATYTTGNVYFGALSAQLTGVCTSELLDNESSESGKSRKQKKSGKKDGKKCKKDKKASKKDKKASKKGKKGE